MSIDRITAAERRLPIESIQPRKDQPRRHFNQAKLQELATSIQTVGQTTPIDVRVVGSSPLRYEIIEGERRWRACQLLERKTIRALVYDYGDDEESIEQAWEHSLIANVQREGYTPKEIVLSIVRLKNRGKGMSCIASMFGKSEPWVYQYARLASLPEDVLDMMDPEIDHKKRLKLQTALLIAQVDGAALQRRMAKDAVGKAMTTVEAHDFVKRTAFAKGQRVGTMREGSAHKDYERLLTFSRNFLTRIGIWMDLPGGRFQEMFASRELEDVYEVLSRFDDAKEEVGALCQAIQEIADKRLNK